MSAPLIWIIFPAAAAIGAWFIRRNRITLLLAGFLALSLAILAWVLPIDKDINVGRSVYFIDSTFALAGRRFVIEAAQRGLLALIYGAASFWFFGALVLDTRRELPSIGLGIAALLVAALAVEPGLYAALIIEACVLGSIPLLTHSSEKVKSGVLRFVSFMTPGMPFLLLAGWALEANEASPANPEWLLVCIILLSFGFGLWLAVFPFNIWIPMLVEQTNPYSAGYILALFPVVLLLLLLGFLQDFSWLRSHPLVLEITRLSGVLTIVTAGFWGAFQKNLARILGYAVVLDVGFSLLAINIGRREGWEMVVAGFVPRVLSIALASMALSILKKHNGSLDFERAKSNLWSLPFASAAWGVGLFSITGLPLLASFPIRERLLEEAAKTGFSFILPALLGIGGLLTGVLRAITTLAGAAPGKIQIKENWAQVALLSAGILLLFIFGLLPGEILAPFKGLLSAFPKLK